MITYEIEDLERTDISMIDSVFLADLCGSTEGYSLYFVRGYDDEIPTRSMLQIIHSDCSGCAAIVLIEAGVPGRVDWMDANSLDDALDLYLGIETTSRWHERTASWRSSPPVTVDGGGHTIAGSAGVVARSQAGAFGDGRSGLDMAKR